ncbi:hypothetical protein ANO14919_040960 [Xylariales sp. No.14919]|nr:hypothetical protein ANO14919_040960 [Xylariales sp. No.14919]
MIQSKSDNDELPCPFGENAETLVYLWFSESTAKKAAAHATRLRRRYPQMPDDWMDIAIGVAVEDGVGDLGPETEN